MSNSYQLRLPLVHRLKPVRCSWTPTSLGSCLIWGQILLITGKEIPLLQAVSTPPQSKTDKPVIYSKDGNVTALIWGASPQSRSDQQKDRVETNLEQLAAASGST
ncbi:hypothetical protein ES319_A10G158500v1 [Gossypium barbadense]|uniref:Uncharacterized protein n=1 Tax=Gossypium barbadense TaxID=3634 RepID=A0A5J5U3M9_GOSBA|nr:hypothetical protein ES319_A10G158500v1 [Gossypium barbadense]KAB2062527.1 hypothetical protein ES319_A10G158500v1 [Gossypium barbadense]KAB2062528.1 hypothetical protein ES319_A10G158500v1 [Gossypium barbadense]KAB2062530.1 hypothetical protein ES319_A10G158500v1 [Gossypium barbadense]KAB2062531.1 hypothetical protein ES319_A10G158500v1 [Gossypium barbadense]